MVVAFFSRIERSGDGVTRDLSARDREWVDERVKDKALEWLAKDRLDKPVDAVDACWTLQAERINEPADPEANNRCNSLYPLHSEPRMVAGEPIGNDIFKCRLVAPKRAAYGPGMTGAQWRRLQQIFPGGVCDYRRSGANRVDFKGPLAALRSR